MDPFFVRKKMGYAKFSPLIKLIFFGKGGKGWKRMDN